MTEIRRYTASLMATLSRDEVHDLGKELAELDIRIFNEKVRQAHERKVMKETLDSMEAERDLLAEKVDTGVEKRDVECVLTADYLTGKAYTMRLDTGEVIAERALKDEERQAPIPLEAERPRTEG